jgi:glycosyltransferase involved in cell wall biosynthesis
VGDIDSEFYPHWEKVDLRGFQRPPWFVQGPLNICIRNLSARRKGNYWQEKFSKYQLKFTRSLEKRPLSILLLPLVLAKRSLTILRKGGWRILVFLRTLRVLTFLHTTLKFSRTSPYKKIYQELATKFSHAFPNRSDQLLLSDLTPYLHLINKLGRLFAEYDVIQTYGTDPILALLSGVRPYLAFEHGTIRSLPFEETSQGRLIALSYRLANGVIITNCDNKRAAERLELPDYRFIPHPINETWDSIDGGNLREKLQKELNADFLLFHPARQHWSRQPKGDPSWFKSNHILIEGIAKYVKESNPKFGAVFVEWGQSVSASKDLIAQLGIEDRIKWITPQHSANMTRYIDACDFVADQFFLGAFGSILPKALPRGKPVMLFLDQDVHNWCFPENPPCINAQTPIQVFNGLQRAYEDKEWLNKLAKQGMEWYETYHSNAVIKDRLVNFYYDVIEKHTT